MEIAVIYSLPSKRMLATQYGAADEDSAIIASKVREGLEFKGYTVTLYPIAEDRIEDIAKIKADCIFNLIEWCGQDIYLAKQAFAKLRSLNLPVTGSDEKRYELTGDKVRLKEALRVAGIRTPRGCELVTGKESLQELTYPVIVKPSREHCSMGLSYDSLADNENELREIANRQIEKFEQPALAEEFIVGREFMVYLIQEQGQIRVLPIEEVIFESSHPTPFQTYEAKWEEKSPEYNSTDVILAKLTPGEQMEIEELAKKTFAVLGLAGYARFDMRMREGLAYILEANANPSVYDGEFELPEINSEVIWGIKFPDYLEKIVRSALWHYKKGDFV